MLSKEFEFVTTKRGLYKRRIGSINLRKICDIDKCLSLSKGKSGKCIKHQKNNICNMNNCKKKLKFNSLYCSLHCNNFNKNILKHKIHKKLLKKDDTKKLQENKNINRTSIKINMKNLMKELKPCKNWLNYYLNDNENNSTKCQGICCSFYNENEKPEGNFCKIENKFLCNLCSIF